MLKLHIVEGKLRVCNEEIEVHNYISRWDWHSFDEVVKIADQLTVNEGSLYLPVDKGEWVSPRFDVIKAPAIGDRVSRGFNGDYYPCGEISSISKTLKKITTTTGHTFYRKRNTATWLCGGTFSIVQGHISKLNPSF